MADFTSILPAAVSEQEAFILDHGKKVDGVLKYKDDLTSYGWNIRQFNKMHVGAFVLNRRPGKLTKDRKFEIDNLSARSAWLKPFSFLAWRIRFPTSLKVVSIDGHLQTIS